MAGFSWICKKLWESTVIAIFMISRLLKSTCWDIISETGLSSGLSGQSGTLGIPGVQAIRICQLLFSDDSGMLGIANVPDIPDISAYQILHSLTDKVELLFSIVQPSDCYILISS